MSDQKGIKKQIEILEKIESFEKDIEFNRFLLIVAFGGLIAIIAGWMEYISFRFIGTSLTFFQFGMAPSSALQPSEEPVLFLSIWIIVIMLVITIILFSYGSSGVISWNRTYRWIGILAITLYLLTSSIILILGSENSNFFPLIWGIALFIGFGSSGYLLANIEDYRIIFKILLFFATLALGLGLVNSIIIISTISMFLFLVIFGISLIIGSAVMYLFIGRKRIIQMGFST